jgi:hypothetical protein
VKGRNEAGLFKDGAAEIQISLKKQLGARKAFAEPVRRSAPLMSCPFNFELDHRITCLAIDSHPPHRAPRRVAA